MSPSPTPRVPRFLLYSHDAFGFGHTRRNLAIASAIRERHPTAPILIASSLREAHRLGLPDGTELLYLPSIRKVANESYAARHMDVPPQDTMRLRSSLLLAAVTTFKPDILLVDKHPLGVLEELVPALEEQRLQGRSCVLGLREILDEPEIVRQEWSLYNLPKRIADYHDRVLIYGHPNIFDPVTEYGFPAEIVPRVRFCGIVLNRDEVMTRNEDRESLRRHDRPTVLATVGGGEDGKHLIETFIAASVDAPWDGIVVAGTMMPPDDREMLARAAADAQLEFHVFLSGLTNWYQQVDAAVCMGGYNTLAEALFKGVPIVCIPRIRPRTEQLIRATALNNLGLLDLLNPNQLTVAALRKSIAEALIRPREELRRRIDANLDFAGANKAAVELLELVHAHAEHVVSIDGAAVN